MLISPNEVAQDRAMAEAEMIDTCRITRDGDGAPTFDNATGQYTDPPRVVVYEGRCRLQVRADINSNAVEAVVGDHEWTYRTATLQIPMFAGPTDSGDPAAVRNGHVAEILTSPLDPSRVGEVLGLKAPTKSKTLASCRKFVTHELLS